MLYVLTPEQRLAIFREIPSEFTVNGHTITTSVRYANQWEDDKWPSIILEYTSLTEKSYDFINLIYTKTNQKIDEIIFHTGTANYSLSMTLIWDIMFVEDS